MLKQATRSLFTAVLVLLLLAASSALAAHGLHPATSRAAHRASVHHKAKRSATRKHKARGRAHRKGVVHQGRSLDADVASVTALLGSTTVESNYDSLIGGQAEAFRLQAGTAGLAGVVHVYMSAGNAARTVFAGLYSNADNHPGSLLSSGSAPASGAGTWTAVSISPVELVSGRTYWLAILGTGGWLRYRDRAGGACPSETSAQTTLTALPASWKNGTVYYDCPASAYVTAPEAPPPPAAPTNSVLPLVSGSAVEGQTLSASTGTWSGSPTSYAHQWEACDALGEGCLSVAGATSSSYKLVATDVGGTMRVVVTASNAGGSTAASSNATATVTEPPPPPPPAPANSVLPSITGSAVEGDTLSASTGTWTGSPTSYSYQWEDCNTSGEACSSISGATGSTYKLVAGDVGHTVRVVVTASNAGGSTPASSSATAAVTAPPPAAPTNTVLPSVSGSVVEGDTLSASTGTWTGSPTSYAYQWEDCNTSGEACSDVSGATSASYKLASSDVGHTARVVVTATNAGGSTPSSSAATATVASAESSGLLVGSSTVQASSDTSSAGSAEAFEYTASASGTVHSLSLYVNSGNTASSIVVGLYSNVSGNPGSLLASATIGSPKAAGWNAVGVSPVAVSSGSVYWLAALPLNGTLAIRDVASGGGPTKSSASDSLKELPSSWSSGSTWANSPASFDASGEVVSVPAAPTNTLLPAITGSAIEGKELTASEGTWTGSPTSYAYQWQDCNSSGAACIDISGATASSYTLGATDVGHTVRVVVTASNAGGSTPASAAATAVIDEDPPTKPTNTTLPAISGSYEEGQRLTATSGAWTGESVSSYGYQWERCSSGSCLAISGATGAEYRLGSEDVGKKMRVEIAAHGAGSTGYASSAESPAVTGATESYTCSMTASETSKIKADLEKAAADERVCIAEGTYGHVTLGTLRYAGTVTLSAAPGKRVNIAGMKLGSVEHLAIEHLNFTEGLENEPGSGDEGYLTIDHDSFGGLTTGDTAEGSKIVTGIPSTASMAVGNAIYAKSISNKASNQSEIAAVLSEHEVEIHSPATSTLSETVIGYGPGTGIYTHPGSGGHTKNFTAEWDTFAALGPCVEKSQSNYNDCGSYKGGQCMTLDGESENVTLAYNTCGPYVAVHYIQVAGKHITVEHNDFLGPSARHDSESHQNYIQIAAESSNITFSNNIMWRTNAENGFELERYSASTSAEKYENITIDNNLEVQNGGLGENAEAPGGIGFDLCPVKGLTMEHNTVVEPSSTGINLRKEGTGVTECDPGDKYTIRHDLVTKGSGVTQPNFSLQSGACEAECESAYIVTQDDTATGEHAVTGWSPSWKASSWNPVQEIVEGHRFPVPPAGYYIPEGLSASGYEGNAGP